MTAQETAQIITILRAAFPYPAISTERYQSMVTVWADVLEDVPFKIAKRAQKEHCRVSKFFPSVSEIYAAAIGSHEMQDAAARREAYDLMVGGRCCPVCQFGPMIGGQCIRCVTKIEGEAEVPQLATEIRG